MSDKTPEELARESLTRKAFKFSDALRHRTYPEDTVAVYLDERGALPLVELHKKLTDANKRLDAVSANDAGASKRIDELTVERDGIIAEIEAVTKSLEDSKYVITVHGVDPGVDVDSLKYAREQYPVEYRDSLNAFTGETKREELESPDRELLFANLIWRSRISKIVAPDGAVDDDITLETVADMRRTLPTASRHRLDEAIAKVNMAVDWYAALADEAFLVKP